MKVQQIQQIQQFNNNVCCNKKKKNNNNVYLSFGARTGVFPNVSKSEDIFFFAKTKIAKILKTIDNYVVNRVKKFDLGYKAGIEELRQMKTFLNNKKYAKKISEIAFYDERLTPVTLKDMVKSKRHGNDLPGFIIAPNVTGNLKTLIDTTENNGIKIRRLQLNLEDGDSILFFRQNANAVVNEPPISFDFSASEKEFKKQMQICGLH